ncbi:unnamed protein product [Peniophora sp. CBMAI 1063]|nr:unnamed protein product [Peniophora sp. CBMAI 1063]
MHPQAETAIGLPSMFTSFSRAFFRVNECQSIKSYSRSKTYVRYQCPRDSSEGLKAARKSRFMSSIDTDASGEFGVITAYYWSDGDPTRSRG